MTRFASACVVALAVVALAVAALAAQDAPKSYALLVGVSAYDHANFGKLDFTEADAEKLAAALDRRGSPFEGRVRVLTCSRGRKKADDAPTAANIRRELAKLCEGKKKRDTVLVGLAGHGLELVVSDPAGKGRDKRFAMFAPQDVETLAKLTDYESGESKRLVNLELLLADLGECGAGSRIVLVDACREEVKARGGAKPRNLNGGALRVPDNTALLMACKSDQRSFESRKLGHGVFFHYVIDGLKGAGGKTLDDGAVTWDRLSLYVRESVRKNVGDIVGGGANQDPREYGGGLGRVELLPAGKAGFSVKKIMRSAHMKGGYRDAVAAHVKTGKWIDSSILATRWLEESKEMSRLPPPKGGKDSWSKQTEMYAVKIAALRKAIDANDAKTVNSVIAAIGTSCTACHREHK